LFLSGDKQRLSAGEAKLRRRDPSRLRTGYATERGEAGGRRHAAPSVVTMHPWKTGLGWDGLKIDRMKANERFEFLLLPASSRVTHPCLWFVLHGWVSSYCLLRVPQALRIANSIFLAQILISLVLHFSITLSPDHLIIRSPDRRITRFSCLSISAQLRKSAADLAAARLRCGPCPHGAGSFIQIKNIYIFSSKKYTLGPLECTYNARGPFPVRNIPLGRIPPGVRTSRTPGARPAAVNPRPSGICPQFIATGPRGLMVALFRRIRHGADRIFAALFRLNLGQKLFTC
jgi:hypothetical protein